VIYQAFKINVHLFDFMKKQKIKRDTNFIKSIIFVGRFQNIMLQLQKLFVDTASLPL